MFSSPTRVCKQAEDVGQDLRLISYLESQGDLVSILVTPISHIVTLLVQGKLAPLSRPETPKNLDPKLHTLNPKPRSGFMGFKAQFRGFVHFNQTLGGLWV